MDKNRIFLILGIEETKDKSLIKQAYYKKLVHVKPEEDPEGFKELRSAYEACVILADKEETQEIQGKNLEETPVDLWMKKVEETYASLSSRIQTDCWKLLFLEETALDLEEGERCKRRFFRFLTEHFRFPSEVWEYLDQRLNIQEDRQELYEYLPRDFVDYMVYHCRHKDWFPYELFCGDDKEDYDSFIKLFFEITRKLDSGETEGVRCLIEQTEELPVYHPYLNLEKIRFLQMAGETTEAQTLLAEMEESLKEDSRYQYVASLIWWEAGEYERSREFCEQILKRDKSHYVSNKHMARYWYMAGDCHKAKDYTVEAMRVSRDKELEELLLDVNRVLIPLFKADLEENPKDGAVLLKLGWCYLQNDEPDAAVMLLEEYCPKPEEEEEYHNLLGKLFYTKEVLKKAEFHLRKWITYLEIKASEDETEKKKDKGRLATAYTMLSRVYRSLAKKDGKSEKERQELYQQALDELEQACIYEEKETGLLLDKASLYMESGKYELCVNTCTAIVDEEIWNFPAVALRQEAYARLKDFHGVMKDFYGAYALFKGYGKMYELAAEASYEIGDVAGLEEVVGLADENQIKSFLLDLYRGRVRRLKAETTDEINQIILYLFQVKDEYEPEGIPGEKLAQLLCELAVCYDILHKEEETQTLLDAAIEADGTKPQYWFLKGDILYSNKQYQHALEIYQICLKIYGEYARLHVGIGDCCGHLGRWEDAVLAYQKALIINPTHPAANGRMTDVYTGLLKESQDIQYYNLALPFADRQVELSGNVAAYMQRGRLAMEAGIWEEAEKSIQQAIQLESENREIHLLLSLVCKYQWKLDQALEEALIAAGNSETRVLETDSRFYRNLADIYLRLGEYQKAIEACNKNIEWFPKEKESYWLLGKIYKRLGQAKEVKQVLGKVLGSGGRLHRELGDLYLTVSNCQKAGTYYLFAYRQGAMTKAEYHYYRAAVYWLQKKPDFMVLVHLKLACKAGNFDGIYPEILRLFVVLYDGRGQMEHVNKYASLCLEYLREQEGCLEKFLGKLHIQALQYYQIGWLYLYLKDVDRARESFDYMDALPRCRGCSYPECWHRLLARALVCERIGEKEEALRLYRSVEAIAGDRAFGIHPPC